MLSLDRLELNAPQASAALAALVLAVGAIAVTTASSAKIPRTKDGKPLPRPSTTLPVLDNTLDLLRNADRLHDWICETSLSLKGEPWLLQILNQPAIVMVSTPDAYEDVERRLFDVFTKGPLLPDCFRDFFGNGIISADGELWAFQRKTAMNLFSSRALREHMAAIINKHTVTLDQVLEKAASSGGEVDAAKLLHQFSMEAFTEFGFGLKLNHIGSETPHPFEMAFDDGQHIITTRMQMPPFVWKFMRMFGIGMEGHLKKCMKILNGTIMDIMKQTMENAQQEREGKQQQEPNKSKKKDVMTLFIESEDAKEVLTPDLLRDIVLALLVAGRDTSAEGMGWLVYCLTQHPEVEQKIREEVKAKIGENIDVSEHIDVDLLPKLTYLEAALKEALRLYPPGSFNMKFAVQDVTLSDGTFVPAGTYVGICPYTTGRRTDIWGEDAAEFKPERWLDPKDPSKLITVSNFKFNAFLGGPRMCIGMSLAMMEMKTVLAKIVSKFHLTLCPGQNVTYRQGITLPIKDGLHVRVERV